MTREEEIAKRLEQMEADRTIRLYAGHVAPDLRYLLDKCKRLEGAIRDHHRQFMLEDDHSPEVHARLWDAGQVLGVPTDAV